MIPKQLSEAEAAVVLNLTVSQVRRLRHKGKLGYTPGRPPRIGEDDIEAYLRAVKRRPTLPPPTEPPTPVIEKDSYADIQRRVREKRLKLRLRSSQRSLG
ncbi:hypothetical protein I8G32_04698 [Rhodopseudomonas palustris]|uniref:Helix-turn-helix domain-containing protein n=1 Tax=Rhodopseudomonas palustris (strain ATCC BAA-98 / CGA009) TaxID=258594 RepID=Q6N167_RHOPA|nr:helix-turn-helix domain-containing protein [Rhodopseudomonas palustris]QQM06118.1 hypothetical protein I8G32_04698 [Rhodopseudomonas palustris]WAB77437.1 hypothetical protein OR798_23615 [Rhodopseudomonas palustris]WCL94748.1 hypothetical protein TX73_023610 [Rhodopseudomonas palustris CGA009]WND51348.1 hypothetical protein L1A21_23530 [Rhodopseudomonas palustris]CAE29982.1 unknown protein [Rhodopseudomonas palustris CGA009]